MTVDEFCERLAAAPDDVRADFVGYLVFDLACDFEVSALRPELHASLERFLTRAGIDDEALPHSARAAKLQAYLQEHPPDAALSHAFRELSDSLPLAGIDAERERAVASFLGSGAKAQVVEERPPAKVFRGPLAMMLERDRRQGDL